MREAKIIAVCNQKGGGGKTKGTVAHAYQVFTKEVLGLAEKERANIHIARDR